MDITHPGFNQTELSTPYLVVYILYTIKTMGLTKDMRMEWEKWFDKIRLESVTKLNEMLAKFEEKIAERLEEKEGDYEFRHKSIGSESMDRHQYGDSFVMQICQCQSRQLQHDVLKSLIITSNQRDITTSSSKECTSCHLMSLPPSVD